METAANRKDRMKYKLEEAIRYMRSKQLTHALILFKELADEGYPEACVEIGNILEQLDQSGNGPDLDEARKWYMRGIEEANLPGAYFGLARMALRGYADAGSVDDAIEYLNIACEANKPLALMTLGILHHEGKIIPQDLIKAKDLYERAAALGYVMPLVCLAKLEKEQGHYYKWLCLKLKAFRNGYKLAKADPHDHRLIYFYKRPTEPPILKGKIFS